MHDEKNCNSYLTVGGGRVDEPRPRRECHVVRSQEGMIFRAGFEVPRQRVAVTEAGERRSGNSAQDPRRRAENLLEVGAETRIIKY